ncbi:MAG: hypothetical protein IPK76_13000 [Lewinellaceae bacterium]|nr:hypothetical protein [Lewinellaceae bacterium]
MDIFVSGEMINHIIANGGLFLNKEVPWWATLLLCLLMNGWAAVTAHFLGKGFSQEIQDWERWNYGYIKMQNNAPPNVLNGDMRKEMLRARFLAITSGAVLLIVVSLIVYYRYVVLKDLGGDVGSFKVLAIVMMVLPIAIVIGELFTGDYIWYSIRWLQNLIGRNQNRRKFLKFKEQCGYADHLAVQYTENARRQNHPVQIVGDLEHCHMRIKHRSQQQNDYSGSFDKWRRIGFTFRARKIRSPLMRLQYLVFCPTVQKPAIIKLTLMEKLPYTGMATSTA